MRCKSCILIIVQHISAHLGPLLATPYVVEACLVPALAKLSGVKQEIEMISGTSGTTGLNLQKAHTLFDFLMASLEVSSVHLQTIFPYFIFCILCIFIFCNSSLCSSVSLKRKDVGNFSCILFFGFIVFSHEWDEYCKNFRFEHSTLMFTLIFYVLLQNHELQKCLENLIICLLTGHKQAAESIHFAGQKYNLRLLYVLLSHTRLRKFCLSNILFDKVR